ncbi:MAG: hypothetical protein ACTSUX_12090 [Promethearchaeota archaeon]
MILTIFQADGLPRELVIVFSVIGVIALLLSILFLKMGLAFTKAKARTNFKWVIISYFIQLLMIAFILSPGFLLASAGAFSEGPNPMDIIMPIIIIFLVEINIINVIHKTGLGSALLTFILMLVPLIAGGVVIGFIMFIRPPIP